VGRRGMILEKERDDIRGINQKIKTKKRPKQTHKYKDPPPDG
jgi:hypothetical protein